MTMSQPSLDRAYAELLQSARVSTPTRAALEARAFADDPNYAPLVLDVTMLATLRSLLDRVIPQAPPCAVDLAARIDQMLARGEGNGWRYASLPQDAAAYPAALRTLDSWAATRYGTSFALSASSHQDELLTNICENRDTPALHPTANYLDASQMRAWFEDVRAEAVRLYILMPRSLAQIGYSGIANGGDGRPKSGFVDVGLDEREDWEPLPLTGGMA